MRPLIDCDFIRYEVGFGAQFKDELGDLIYLDFSDVVKRLDDKIEEICEGAWGDEEPVLYLTGDEVIRKNLNRLRRFQKRPELPKKDNFRVALSTTTKYKNRKSSKPYHFKNLTNYILHNYNTKVAWGIEADDLLSIDHRKDPENTIICSRDKDLRITPGLHYCWECGKQPASGPDIIDELGSLTLVKNTLKGGGLKFFYSQLITGDSTDSIPGLPGKGPVTAYKALNECDSEVALYEVVKELYKQYKEDSWMDYLQEQASLLWMVRELDEQGNPILYKFPE